MRPKKFSVDEYSTIETYNHSYHSGYEFGVSIFDHFPILFDKESDVEKAFNLYRKFIEQDAIPFFNYWTDITVLIPYLETGFFEPDNYKALSGDWVVKRAIIWYQTSHPKFEEYYQFHMERYESLFETRPRDEKDIKKAIKKMNTVYKKLKNSDPLYEWDPAFLIKKPFI